MFAKILIATDGSGYRRLTDNSWLDCYPCWSPDGREILFLSWPDYPDNTMDIFLMDSSGTDVRELFDSGFHDGDCCWVGQKIVFTRESQIWIMDDDGTDAGALLAGLCGAGSGAATLMSMALLLIAKARP